MCSDGFVSYATEIDTEIDQNGESMVRRSSVVCPISGSFELTWSEPVTAAGFCASNHPTGCI